MELDETLNQWKQRAHLMTLLNPPLPLYPNVSVDGLEDVERDDFVERFCEGDLGDGRFARGVERQWKQDTA
jgi:hypothetical protein